MNKLDEIKIARYRNAYGNMTSAEALSIAIDNEKTASDCGPFDLAFPHFKQKQRDFEEYARLIEKEEQEGVVGEPA